MQTLPYLPACSRLLRRRLYNGGNNFIDGVVCRHLEQCYVGRSLLNVLEGIGCFTKARITLRALNHELQLGRVPGFADDIEVSIVPNRGRRDGAGRACSCDLNALKRLGTERLCLRLGNLTELREEGPIRQRETLHPVAYRTGAGHNQSFFRTRQGARGSRHTESTFCPYYGSRRH